MAPGNKGGMPKQSAGMALCSRLHCLKQWHTRVLSMLTRHCLKQWHTRVLSMLTRHCLKQWHTRVLSMAPDIFRYS